MGLFLRKQDAPLPPEEIYTLVAPATVEIQVDRLDGSATGTGFFYGKEGWIVTNYHVIENSKNGHIVLPTGETYDILKLIGCDAERDIAILDVAYMPETTLTKRDKPIATGEAVYALGSSLGLTGSFSEGIISTAAREYNGVTYLQTTAPISQGNSGGPLVDAYGNLVGITTAAFADGQNLNLAIPVDYIDLVDTNDPIIFYNLFPSDATVIALAPLGRPFAYKEDGIYKGIHIDIIKQIINENILFVEVDQDTAVAGVNEKLYLAAIGYGDDTSLETLLDTTEYYDGFNIIYYGGDKKTYSFSNWVLFSKTVKQMMEDGRMAQIFASYGLEWKHPST